MCYIDMNDPFGKGRNPFEPKPLDHGKSLLEDYLKKPRHKAPWEDQIAPLGWPETKKATDELAKLLDWKIQEKPLPIVPTFKFVDNAYRLTVALTGYNKKDVALELVDDNLKVDARHGGLFGQEKYTFTTKLPVDANLDSAVVTLTDGVLRVQLLKREPKKTHLTIQ